jgi:hypothetical protein
MALVDDDEIEEVRGELTEDPVRIVPTVSERLVQREVDLTPCLRFALQLPDRGVVAGPKAGLYSRSIGWSTSMLRSAK